MNEISLPQRNSVTSPRISVVICTRNRAHILFRVLESLRMQTYPNWEAIVVDDYSDDATWRTLGYVSDPRIRYVRNIREQGELEARNFGVACASGSIISYLDDDNILYPTALEALSEMPAEASWGAFYRNITVIKLENRCEVARSRGTSAGRKISRSSLIALETRIDANCLFHRPWVLSDVGGWRSLVRHSAYADTYLAANLALKHFDDFWLLPQVLVDYQTTVGADGDGRWGKRGFQLHVDFLTEWLREFKSELSDEQQLSLRQQAAVSRERALRNEPIWADCFQES
jgi:glycosyltransferase involved in cell wall biosynthesis